MKSQGGPKPGQYVAASPWTRPPEQPAPYRLPARLSDMLHGWLDGRRGIPELPNDRISAVGMVDSSDTETDDPKLSDSPDAAKPQIRPPTLWTPRIEVLVRQSRELIEEERIRFADDWSELKRRSIDYQLSLDPLKEQVTALEDRLNQARVQPSNTELGKRRLAEQDAGSRPDTLVNSRRQAAWDRRLSTVEGQHQSATAKLARAAYAFRLHEDLIRERAEVARAAARRHHEFALRRVATYLQQLVRKHPRGSELNEWLMDYRVGPDLPEWARESAEAESAIKSMLTSDSTPSTGNDSSAETKRLMQNSP
jgi:hypothetical protein